ncbi:12678_t:CDS:10 [Dentiscutata erythropus]|uniref:12678_t:CDS:1 n=1 Tax=Dentiscutata erythropus TaxID=1348616 RepID=A0A9N9GMD0_9GLOM|nr:12678_t:CDS:10 [Dentiscutata erythropus]
MSYIGPGFITKCSKPGVVALTFDDGPGPYTNILLDYLSTKKIKVTFFVLGISAEKYPEVLKKILEEGHQIGIHTFTHPHLNDLSYEQQKEEISKANDTIYKISGVIPNYMRQFLFSNLVASLNTSLDLIVTQWNMDSIDWRYETASYQEQRSNILNNILTCLSSSNPKTDSFISLQHDPYKYSIDVVPEIVEAFEKNGYTFETIAECLVNNVPPYKNVNEGGNTTKNEAKSSAKSNMNNNKNNVKNNKNNMKNNEKSNTKNNVTSGSSDPKHNGSCFSISNGMFIGILTFVTIVFEIMPKERSYKLGGDGKNDTPTVGTVDSSAAAEAAERRVQQAQSRGVQKGGGKLSKRLDERQKSPSSDDHPPDANLENLRGLSISDKFFQSSTTHTFKMNSRNFNQLEQSSQFIAVKNQFQLECYNNKYASNILPKLYLGSLVAATDENWLKEHKITHILTVADSVLPSFPESFTYKVISIRDHPSQNISKHFEEVIEFIQSVLDQEDGNILVHCHQGVSRSASVVIAYIMRSKQQSLDDALSFVKGRRSAIRPNTGFLQQLKKYESTILIKTDINRDNSITIVEKSTNTENSMITENSMVIDSNTENSVVIDSNTENSMNID